MASSMRAVNTPFMLTVPCDSPFVPDDLAKRLYLQMIKKEADISVAHDGSRIQPVFVMLKTSLLDSMLDFLNKGERKIDKWFEKHSLAVTDFSDKPDTFININNRDDLSLIESRLKERG
jgi:molybdopterin-guanine dinucleotide biosynthesis protein A